MQQVQTNSEQLSRVRRPAWFVIGFLVSMAIALAAVIRRLIVLVHPSEAGLGPGKSLDAVFSSHARLTCFHIVPASVFVCLAALFVLRRKSGGLTEAMLYPFGMVTGLTAYLMSSYAIPGW